MSARLHNRIVGPPGGWRYHVEPTGTWMRGANLSELLSKIADHYAGNKLGEPPTRDEIEAQLCESLDGNWCIDLPENIAEANQELGFSLTWEKMLAGTKTIVDAALNGKPVAVDEAERRAIICSKCRQNVSTSACVPCNVKSLQSIVSRLVGAKKTTVDGLLRNCKTCGCSNKAQVWVDLEILQKHLPERFNALLPPNCWKKRT